jgi:hypothetical protein
MNRRDFARSLSRLLLSASALPYLGQRTVALAEGTEENCGICGSPAVFDNWLDINLCRKMRCAQKF